MNADNNHEEKFDHVGEVIHDLDLIPNETDEKRKSTIKRLKKAMKELKGMHKRIKTALH